MMPCLKAELGGMNPVRWGGSEADLDVVRHVKQAFNNPWSRELGQDAAVEPSCPLLRCCP